MEPLEEFDGVFLDGLVFCARVYALFEELRQSPDGRTRLRNRASNVEKKLLDELLPICKYIQYYYRAGRYISVCWRAGNQSFDAELQQSGALIDHGIYPSQGYLEVSGAMHPNEHWIWKLLSAGQPAFAPEGISKERGKPVKSQPIAFSNTEHISNFAPFVLECLRSKAEIAYPPNTSLVIQCSLNSLYSYDDWLLLIDHVQSQMPAHRFREILLFEGTREYVTPLV